jgi:hypothetical protein
MESIKEIVTRKGLEGARKRPMVNGQGRHIYLTVDIGKTYEAVRKRAEEYNEQVKIDHPETYKAMTIKGTHLNTMKELVHVYAFQCIKNKKQGLPHDRVFRLTYGLMAKKSFNSHPTIWRHLTRLIQAGLLVKNGFHGTNAAGEYQIDISLLVAEISPDVQAVLEKSPEKLTISFTSGSTGLISFCNHTSKQEALNIKGGDVEKFSQAQTLKTNDLNFVQKQSDKKQEAWTVRQGNPPEGGGNGTAEGDNRKDKVSVGMAVNLAWGFLNSTLYKGRTFTEDEINHTKQHLKLFFTANQSSLNGLLNIFMQRIILKYRISKRKPEYFLPNPSLWMDPTFEYGFKWTNQPYMKIQEKRKKGMKYAENLHKISQVCRLYVQNPTLDMFKKCENTLSKYKDPICLEVFYNVASAPENINQTLVGYGEKE